VSDRPLILAGLTLFVGLVTTPSGTALSTEKRPSPLRRSNSLPGKAVRRATSYMRSSHMRLLEDWRNEAVRDGQRQFVAFNGKTYDKNPNPHLRHACHTDRKEFCGRAMITRRFRSRLLELPQRFPSGVQERP